MSTKIVTIKKNVYPDVQVVVPRKRYNDEIEYYLVSFIKSESLIIEEKCDEEGNQVKSYDDPKHHACRLHNDVIEVCNERNGWIPACEELNKEYADQLANKELL